MNFATRFITQYTYLGIRLIKEQEVNPLNSEPSDESGNFTAKVGYNGIFFKFSNNTAYIVQNTTMKNIYTGAAIVKFA